MSTPTFPTTLPKPSMRQYSLTPVNNLLRTEMESGPARTRRRYISVPIDVRVVWHLTLAELAAFQAFYRDAIYDGAGWFLMPVVMGDGEAQRKARFKEPYQADTVANEHCWRVTATLEVMEL
jgi:hypothetical protein